MTRGGLVFLSIVATVAIVVPLLNLAVPPTSPLHLSAYGVTLIGKYLCYATLALAVDLVWGYCGILSLGHAAFFALGGYAMGMYLMRQVGTRGVYQNPVLPRSVTSNVRLVVGAFMCTGFYALSAARPVCGKSPRGRR